MILYYYAFVVVNSIISQHTWLFKVTPENKNKICYPELD